MTQIKFHIEVRRGAKSLREYTFNENKPISIGRAAEADVRLESREVSRRHAVVTPKKNGFTLDDLSLNGLETSEKMKGKLHSFGTRFLNTSNGSMTVR